MHDFTVLYLGDGMPTSVQVDNGWSATSVSDKPREVGRFTRTFNALTASALPPEDTPAFLQELTRETPNTPDPSYSDGAGNNCVEVADLTAAFYSGIAIRDSKNLQGAALFVAPSSFAVFVEGVRRGGLGS